MPSLVLFLLLLLYLVTPSSALAAGFLATFTDTGRQPAYRPQAIAAFAKKVETELARQGAQVAIVARKGRPETELPEGMAFTHAGFAVYSTITTDSGQQIPGYAMHNLYQRDEQPDISDLIIDFPADFFSGVATLEAGAIIPSARLQQQLLAIIDTPRYASLHDPRYSLIASPFTEGKQNCTEFVLDVLLAASRPTAAQAEIKTIKQQRFTAQPVRVGFFRLFLGALLQADVAVSDHQGQPETATFETIWAYLAANDPGSRLITIMPDAVTPAAFSAGR